ncbi:hypothetical protein H0H92_002598 [Tricholoma furcatifolium]|nr:hypothetical protein H0H92_002598 [Tricholoma furcatifolium]
MTIVGSDPLAKDNNTNGDSSPQNFGTPGPHRYIGIGMVLGLAFLVLVLWLSLGRWPRKKMRDWGWLKATPESEESTGGDLEKPRLVDEIILPKQPEKVKGRKGEHRGRRAVASWEPGIDYTVMKHHAYFESEHGIASHRTHYMPPDLRS